MAVRRRRPLVPPPYPRRNRYTPASSGQSPLNSVSAVSLRLAAKTAFAFLPLLFDSQTLRSRWRLCRLTDAACPLRVLRWFVNRFEECVWIWDLQWRW